MEKKYNPDCLEDLLPLYYKRLFPHQLFSKWLSYYKSEPNIFINREISFTLRDDIYLRYLSFENGHEMEKEICSQCPWKIDIGAVMSVRPKNFIPLIPIQRELVFDIDMTDYNEVRTCCEEANICTKCWKYMAVGSRIIDACLREDFGFEHILWVFSGRRGIHCWVCDKTARHLDGKRREALAEYLNIATDNKWFSDKIHHSIRRALKMIEPVFEEIVVKDQNLFATSKGVQLLLQTIPDENIQIDLSERLKKFEGNSKGVWEQFIQYFISIRGTGNLPRKLKNIIEDVQLKIVYPKLDIMVTKGMNHLLKAPFCIHPKTGKVCVPFSPNVGEKFDPTLVPTIVSLCDEIDAFDQKNKNTDSGYSKKIKDYKKTGMFKGVVIFEEFLRKLEASCKPKLPLEINEKSLEF